jgi:putative endonuclease
MVPMVFFVYMLECSDGTLYTGSTGDLKKRLHAHNSLSSGARYTRSRRPVKLVYAEKCGTLREARRREYELKQLKRWQKLELIGQFFE